MAGDEEEEDELKWKIPEVQRGEFMWVGLGDWGWGRGEGA